MNCNSNTVSLIEGDGNNLNCNNGCVPKDINVICRKIIIPFGQNVLAIQGENNSNTRTFIVPKINDLLDWLIGYFEIYKCFVKIILFLFVQILLEFS